MNERTNERILGDQDTQCPSYFLPILPSYQGTVPLPSLTAPYHCLTMTLPAVVAAVVAADHLLDLLEQRLGGRLYAARVRLHTPDRVSRGDKEGAERGPA